MAREALTGTAQDELRHRLRAGNLAEALLQPGAETVLRSGDRKLTRDELRSEAARIAGGLQRLGVKPGDRVAVYAANSLDWVLAYRGVIRAGACAVMMNPDYHSAEAEHILRDAEPKLVIADGARREIVGKLGFKAVPVEHLPRGEPPPMPALSPESPAAILYTSGTTGRPKGALLDHGNFLAQGRGALEVWRWTDKDVLVHALPLFHLHGLGMGLHGTLLGGGSAVLIPFTPEDVVRELTQGGGTMFFGVPSMYQRLCEWLEQNPTDLSHVRVF